MEFFHRIVRGVGECFLENDIVCHTAFWWNVGTCLLEPIYVKCESIFVRFFFGYHFLLSVLVTHSKNVTSAV